MNFSVTPFSAKKEFSMRRSKIEGTIFKKLKNKKTWKDLHLRFYLLLLVMTFLTLIVNKHLHAQTYCTPSTTSGATNHIINFTTTGAFTNINNSSQGNSDGYEDFTNLSASTYEGSTIEYTITPAGTGTYGRAMWIDWNQNGIFENSEKVLTSTSYASGPFIGDFTVPLGTIPGDYRLRVLISYTPSNPNDPCSNSGSGEYEDYTINIFDLQDCTTAVAGTIETTHSTVCPDDEFTLTAIGATSPANDLTYQWQSSPSGTNNWVNIANGTNPIYNTDGLVDDTDYRFIVSCAIGSLSDTSNIITVNATPPNQCYCTPTTTSGANNHIINFTTTGAASNINNSSQGTPTGYQDFTNLFASTHEGATVGYIITNSGTGTYGRAMWIDWNQNGIFENAEKVLTSNSYASGPFTGDFTVPQGTAAGDYRLRVLISNTPSNPNDPCSNSGSGEYEDYTINIFDLQDCDITVAGTISSNMNSVCFDDDFILSTSGATTPAIDLNYQWQSSPSGSNIWTDIPNAVELTFNTNGLSDDTDYRFIVSCTISHQSDTSNVITVSANAPLACYCEPIYTSGDYTSHFSTSNGIDDVTFTATSVYNYNDFSATDTISVFAGTSFDFDHTYVGGSNTVVMWVDWDENGVFDNTTEKIYEFYTSSATQSGTINIPITTTPGNYRLRMRSRYSSTVPTPCSSETYGSALDYTLRVVPLPDCSTLSTPDNWLISSNMDTLCEHGDITLTISEAILGSNINYIFQSSSNGTTWTNLNTGSLDLSIDINNVNQTTQYRALWLCNGVVRDSTNAITILVADAPSLLAVEDGQNCGVGQVTMNASATPGAQVAWYDDINSNSPIHVGNSYTTPVLGVDQTYYVSSFVGPAGSPDAFIGNGTTVTTGTPQPFYTSYWGNKNQYLIRASELIDAGYTPGAITEVIFDVVAANGLPLNNFTIKIGNTTNTTTTATFDPTLTTVYTATAPENLTANTPKVFVLDNSFIWDGASNIIIETCFSNSSSSSGHSVRTTNVGFNASTYQYGNNANVCGTTSGYTSQVRPNIKLTIDGACRSPKEEVHALIHPEVNLNIATHQNLCVSPEQPGQLDAGAHANNVTYLWDNGSTGRYREVLQSGVYSVTVTNEFGCSASEDIEVTIRQNPIVDLGADTTLCLRGSIELDAGPDGATYSWSNGITTRYNEITTPGTYTVLVAAANGCVVIDTIEITFSDQEIASLDGIQVHGAGVNSFQFQALNPQNVTDYLWFFGDGNTSTTPIPTHTYATNGNYIVVLEVSNECGVITDSISTHIVSIGEKDSNKNQITVYPNPTNGKVMIKNETNVPMNKVTINDALGRTLTTFEIDDSSEYFNKEIDLSLLAEGMYWINIHTNQGTSTQKINLIK